MAPVGLCGALLHTVHAGCMAGCVRPRKTHLRRATFCSFCLNTLRVILTDDLCVRRTWKIKPEKELEQDFSICFRIDDSEQCGTKNSVQHCRVAWTVAQTAVVGGKRHLRLGFVFYTEKSWTPCVLAVLVLCLRSLAFVSVSARPPRVCKIWLTRLQRLRAINIRNCSWCSALHHSTVKLDEKEVFLEVEDTPEHLRL